MAFRPFPACPATFWTSLIPMIPAGAEPPAEPRAPITPGAVEATTAPIDPATTAPTTAAMTGI